VVGAGEDGGNRPDEDRRRTIRVESEWRRIALPCGGLPGGKRGEGPRGKRRQVAGVVVGRAIRTKGE